MGKVNLVHVRVCVADVIVTVTDLQPAPIELYSQIKIILGIVPTEYVFVLTYGYIMTQIKI